MNNSSGSRVERPLLILLLQTQILASSCGTNRKPRWWNWRINERDGAISGTATLPWFCCFSCWCESCWCLCSGSADISDAGLLIAVPPSCCCQLPLCLLASTSSVFRCSAASCSCSAMFLPERNVRLTARPEPNLWKIWRSSLTLSKAALMQTCTGALDELFQLDRQS